MDRVSDSKPSIRTHDFELRLRTRAEVIRTIAIQWRTCIYKGGCS